jgi:flagellar hook-length control protein FliK
MPAETNTLASPAVPAETNVSAPLVTLSARGRETETEGKNFPDRAAERPQSAETQRGETEKLAAENASRETKPRESQNAGAAKLSDANENINENENTEDTGRKTSFAREDGEHTEKSAAEKSETRVPKAVSRAADTIRKSGGQENADAGKSPSGNFPSEKSSPEHAESLSIPAVNPFGAPSRAEAQPVFQAPAVDTLTSGEKVGEGLRSVLTVMTQDGGAEARIVVEPPALGRVDVSLRTSGGGVEANFKVDNEELRQMVQKQLDSLKESLNAQGIHVSGLTVDIKNSEGDRDRGNMGASKKGRRPGRQEQADEDISDGARVLRLDLEQGLLHWVA